MKSIISGIAVLSLLTITGIASASEYDHDVPFKKRSYSYDYKDYSSSASTKIFSVSGSSVDGSVAGNIIYDTEIRNYDRSISGQIKYSRDRKQGGEYGVGVNFSVITLDSSDSEIALSKFERFNNAGTVLKETRVMTPSVVFRTGDMKIGKTFGSYSNLNSSKKGNSSVIQTVALLGLEDVNVAAGSFSSCLKTSIHRNSERLGGEFDRISWYCPNGVGLAKQVVMTSTRTATVWELTTMMP